MSKPNPFVEFATLVPRPVHQSRSDGSSVTTLNRDLTKEISRDLSKAEKEKALIARGLPQILPEERVDEEIDDLESQLATQLATLKAQNDSAAREAQKRSRVIELQAAVRAAKAAQSTVRPAAEVELPADSVTRDLADCARGRRGHA